MRTFRSAVLAAASLSALGGLPAAPAAAAPLVLAPASPWQFREYEDRCRASRVFGEGEDSTTLWIEQGGVEPIYNLTLIGRPLRHPQGRGIYVRFGEHPEFVRSYIALESSKGRPVLTMYWVTITQPQMERDGDIPAPALGFDVGDSDAITTLSVRGSIAQPLRLEIGPMLETFGTLGLCGAKLSGLLGQAGEPTAGQASPPLAVKSDRWLTPADYPAYLANAEMEGQLTVRLTVNRAGRASSCFVMESNKPQLFDDTVCLALMKRAEFQPARDASGTPVASYYFYTVKFVVK